MKQCCLFIWVAALGPGSKNIKLEDMHFAIALVLKPLVHSPLIKDYVCCETIQN